MPFNNLRKKSKYFIANRGYCITKEGLIDLVCRDCEFWKEDERDYECGALVLLRTLLEKNVLSIEDIVRAASE